eukprot:jgi/Galph1/5474/GphlegSOOS_G4158.1
MYASPYGYGAGAWSQRYPSYNSPYGAYPYGQPYGYPPNAVPPYGGRMTAPYPPPVNYGTQSHALPALTFDGMENVPNSGTASEKERILQLVQLSAFEESRYEQLWKKASRGDPYLSGKLAKAFFEKAVGVNRPALKRIWSIADTEHRGMLDREEFFVALRLLAIKQRGSEPSVYSLQRFRGMQLLPEFNWESEKSPVPSSNAAIVENTEENMTQDNNSVTASRTSPVSWSITEQQRNQYDHIFDELDWARGSLVSFSQAYDYFSKWEIPDHLIQRSLKLADISGDESLDKREFRIAAHLCTIAKTGGQLPSELPYSLSMEYNYPLNKETSSTLSNNNVVNYETYDAETLRSQLREDKVQTEQIKRQIQDIRDKISRLKSEKKVVQNELKSYESECQRLREQISDSQVNYYVETSFFSNDMDYQNNNNAVHSGAPYQTIQGGAISNMNDMNADLPPPPPYSEVIGSSQEVSLNNSNRDANKRGSSSQSTQHPTVPSPPTSEKSGKGGFSLGSMFSRRASEKKNQ